MSETPNAAESDHRDAAFTCSTLLMCLYIPGLSKKKPAGEIVTSWQPTTEQDQPTAVQQEPQRVPSRAASSLNSGSNIVFDFMVEPEERDERGGGGGARAVHGYCPSPCFDLPVELIMAGERYGVVDSGTPVTSAFVFDGYQRGALKKVASCLPSGVPAGREARPPHLVRFLSASGSSVPVVPARPSVMSSCGPPEGTYHEFADRGRGVIQPPFEA